MLAVLLRTSLVVEKLGSPKFELYLESLSAAALGAFEGLSSCLVYYIFTNSPSLDRNY